MPPAEGVEPRWPIEGIARALDAETRPVDDVAFGSGHALDLLAGVAVELYPEGGVIRLTGAAARLELFRQDPPRVEHQRGAILFEHQTAEQRQALAITAAGDITLWLSSTPPSPLQDQKQEQEQEIEAAEAITAPAPVPGPETARSAAGATAIPNGVQTPVLAHSSGPEGAVFPASGNPRSGPERVPGSTWESTRDMSSQGGERAKQPRLSLLGRVGTEPRFRTLPSGTLMASFRLAVHDDAGNTSWRSIRAFGTRAERLQEKLAKGDLVEVIGYLHEQQKQLRDGQTKIVQEVYAAVVKRATQPSDDAS